MHQYLKAIGFCDVKTKKEERELLRLVENDFSYNEIISLEQEDYTQFGRKFGDKLGITQCGTMDRDDFERDYYFPYFKSDTVSSYADMIVNKRKDSESYMGVCEDVRMGVTIIFYLQNPLEYLKVAQRGLLSRQGSSVSFSGLAQTGMILLPIMKTKRMIQNSQEESRNRMMLVSAARKGDTHAMESLTLEEMDTYSKISKRIMGEDVFSIVDTYFMPYGIECDEYSVLGEIKELQKIENEYTHKFIYHMVLEINEMHIEVCTPVDSLIGEPQVGRRFKGVVWLQGYIHFPE